MTDKQKLDQIAAILDALHNGDDGELTPGQARSEAIKAIVDTLIYELTMGEPISDIFACEVHHACE